MKPLPPRIKHIITEVAARHGVKPDAILGRAQDRTHTRARHDAMRVIRALECPNSGGPCFSFPQIGRFFDRDHTTVLQALNGKARKPIVRVAP